MTPPQLLWHLRELGYAVNVTGEKAELVSLVKGAFVPARTMAVLKESKAALVAWLTRCRGCGRDNGCAEDRERLRFPLNPFCEVTGCPFRDRGD